jgi:hypothetical protein
MSNCLGPDIEPHVALLTGDSDAEPHERSLCSAGRQIGRAILETRLSGIDDRRDEVVIIDPGKPKLRLRIGLCRQICARHTFFLGTALEDCLGSAVCVAR